MLRVSELGKGIRDSVLLMFESDQVKVVGLCHLPEMLIENIA